jgi:hypothetical protein
MGDPKFENTIEVDEPYAFAALFELCPDLREVEDLLTVEAPVEEDSQWQRFHFFLDGEVIYSLMLDKKTGEVHESAGKLPPERWSRMRRALKAVGRELRELEEGEI